MRQEVRVSTAVTLVMTGVLLISPSSASAAYLGENHGYTQQAFSNGSLIYGGYMSSTNTQEHLFSNWTSTHNLSFITKEMWFAFNENEWMEVGAVDGSVNVIFWNGHFQALNRFNSSTGKYEFREFTIGSKGPTGTHNYQIQPGGTNASGSWVNWTGGSARNADNNYKTWYSTFTSDAVGNYKATFYN